MAEGSMFPLPKEHWLPHQGVKQCMSCSSVFVKTLFGSNKENCRKCGRVVCKQCLRYKIKEVRVCNECFQIKDNDIIRTKQIYERGMRNIENSSNPYLSQNSLKQHEQEINIKINRVYPLQIDRTRSHSAEVSTTSTVPIPHSLLDLTTDIPLPTNNVPSPNIISPLIKEDEENDVRYDDFKYNININKNKNKNKNKNTKIFRERKVAHTRHSSQSVGNIDLSSHDRCKSNGSNKSNESNISNISNTSSSSYLVKRKSITVTKWIDDDAFEIDEKMMKLYEDKTYIETKIKNTEPLIIRLDGYGFGMFTNKMDKPFDKRFHSAMINTACDLLREFEPYTAFTQSDEIVLIYPSNHHKIKVHYLFGGKIPKILSVLSSFASVRLIYHLQREDFGDNIEIQRKINNCFATFNGKCFNISNNDEIFNYIIWRLKKNIRGYKKILTVGNEFCHGTYVKKEKYIHHRKNKERERITSCCVQIESTQKKYHQLLINKYWKNIFLETIQKKQETQKIKNNKSNDRLSFDDNEIFPDIYNTMIIHDVNEKNKTPSIIPKSLPRFGPGQPPKLPSKPKPKTVTKRPQSSKAATQNNHKSDHQKYCVIPKRKSLPIKKDVFSIAAKFEADSRKPTAASYQIRPKPADNNNNNKTKQRRPPNPTSTKPKPSAPLKPKPKPKIKPAAENPNYKYNYNINLNEKNIRNAVQPKKYKSNSPKPMTAKDRIKLMNARLEKMHQQI